MVQRHSGRASLLQAERAAFADTILQREEWITTRSPRSQHSEPTVFQRTPSTSNMFDHTQPTTLKHIQSFTTRSQYSVQSSPSTRPPRPRLAVGVGRERSSHRIRGKDADRLAGVLAAECRALDHLNLPDSRAQIQYTIREEMKRGSLKRTETL